MTTSSPLLRMSFRMSSMPLEDTCIVPDWPAAANIHACCTTRDADFGMSQGPYARLNLGQHVGDQPEHVAHNRQQLVEKLGLPAQPLWLDQRHGRQVLNGDAPVTGIPRADAAYSLKPGVVCAVMTADCLPLLICNRQGSKIAAVHAGWRGLAAGVIEASIAPLEEDASELLVWLGPAIGPRAFEVGEEVRRAFVDDMPAASAAFEPNRPGHYLADIYRLARLRLQRIGVEAIYGGEYCTYSDARRFYSYRRETTCGRQLSLIWRDC